jgi:lipid-A-disaccharide synthase
MQATKHVVIIAGEESGDLHAAKLIYQLKKTNPTIRVSGIGGSHMQHAGAELVSDLARYGVTGLTEVFRHLKVIRKALNRIKDHLKTEQPDLLILVDYPGFNLRLARYAKQELGLNILYYISPQIWAWKAKRIHHIKKYIDQMAVIFPFEKDLYAKAGVPAQFVGHPLVETIQNTPNQNEARMVLKLPLDEQIISLLPGSRCNEVERHMPILVETARLLHQHNEKLRFIIPIAPTINEQKIKEYCASLTMPIYFIKEKATTCMSAADFVIVASGTASLECALLEKPMCIIYKASFLTYAIVMKVIRIKFLGLCNILSKKMVVPEFLQYDCNALEISRYVINFYQDLDKIQYMTSQLSELKKSMSSNESDCSLSDLVERKLYQINP